MKRLWMCLGLFMALAGVRANAQQNVETWQGTLHVGQDLRLVLQVTKTDAVVTGRLYSIDQGPGGMGTTTLSMDGGVLKFTILGMDCSYEGKLSPDGKSAAGIWKQGGHDTPLVLEHVNADAAWDIPKTTTALSLMDPGLTPGYEVATIKPSKPDEQGEGFNLRGQHIVVTNMSARELILLAYNLHPKQISDAPSWLAEVHYDMEILPDHDGLPSLEQARGIVRKLLADRFAFKFHDETRDMPAYVLTVAKTGSKLMKSGADPKSPPGMGGPPGRIMMRNGSMEEFAQLMQGTMDRPVIDQTGLKDRYDLKLNWTPDASQYGGRIPPPNNADNGLNADPFPPLFTAIQEQLGLRLVATKAPVKIMVIDNIDKPSPN
ncbi:MAG: TIGR03435 family protein [Acidobacteriaceae bacterium]